MSFQEYAAKYKELTAKEKALQEQAKSAPNSTEAAMLTLKACEVAQQKKKLTIKFMI